jgi:hypothetical protein
MDDMQVFPNDRYISNRLPLTKSPWNYERKNVGAVSAPGGHPLLGAHIGDYVEIMRYGNRTYDYPNNF